MNFMKKAFSAVICSLIIISHSDALFRKFTPQAIKSALHKCIHSRCAQISMLAGTIMGTGASIGTAGYICYTHHQGLIKIKKQIKADKKAHRLLLPHASPTIFLNDVDSLLKEIRANTDPNRKQLILTNVLYDTLKNDFQDGLVNNTRHIFNNNTAEKIRGILARGLSANTLLYDAQDNAARPILYIATALGNITAVKTLLEQGADPLQEGLYQNRINIPKDFDPLAFMPLDEAISRPEILEMMLPYVNHMPSHVFEKLLEHAKKYSELSTYSKSSEYILQEWKKNHPAIEETKKV
jgi:hypothetical protein